MWNICTDRGLTVNLEFIFPTKQRDAVRIVNCISKVDTAVRVIIFGSSITSACNPWSDIDLYVEYDGDPNRPRELGVDLESALDYWDNSSVPENELLYTEIMKKGVVVWERPC